MIQKQHLKPLLIILIATLTITTAAAQELTVENPEQGDWINAETELTLNYVFSEDSVTEITIYFEDEQENQGVNGEAEVTISDGGGEDNSEEDNEVEFTVTADADEADFNTGELDLIIEENEEGQELTEESIFLFDNEDPEYIEAVTGETLEGNNEDRNKITLEIDGIESGLSDVSAANFELEDSSSETLTIDEVVENQGIIEIKIDEQLETDEEVTIHVDEELEDNAGNIQSSTDSINTENGLIPQLTDVQLIGDQSKEPPFNEEDMGSAIDVTVNLTFSEDISSVREVNIIELDGQEIEVTQTSLTDNEWSGEFTLDEEEIQAEPNVEVLEAQDDSSKENTLNEDSSFSFLVDDTAPEIDIQEDENNDHVTDEQEVMITAEVSDGIEVDDVRLDASELGGPDDTSLENTEGETYEETFTVDASSIEDGEKTVTITSTDSAGNENSSERKMVLDTEEPILDQAKLTDVDEIEITLLDEIGSSEVDPAGINVDPIGDDSFEVKDSEDNTVDYSVSGKGGFENGANPVELTLELNQDVNTGEDITVESNEENPVRDMAGNEMTDTISADNDIPPELEYAVVNPDLSDSSITFVTLKFSEDIDNSIDGSIDIDVDGKLEILGEEPVDEDNPEMVFTHYEKDSEPSALQTGNMPNITDLNENIVDTSGSNVADLSEDEVISTFRRELNEGWNLVSFPIADNTETELTDLIDESTLENAWIYDSEDEGSWDSYPTGFSEVVGGEGYLIELSEDTVIEPNVNNVIESEEDEFVAPASEEISEGWNLIGHFQEYNQDPDSTETGAFYSLGDVFNAVYGQQESGTISYTGVNQVQPGNAYWVSTRGDLSGSVIPYTENQEN